MKRNLFTLFVLLVACGTTFAYTNFSEVPPGTAPTGGESHAFTAPAPSAVTFYDNEADFLAAAGAVVNESFSNSTAEPGGVCAGDTGVLNSATNDGCFSAGDVIDGFSILALTGVYVTLGTDFLGNPIPVVGPNTFTDDMDLTFDPPSNAVAFQLVGDLVGPVNCDIAIFGEGGVFLDSINVSGSLSGTFVGMTSPDAITLLEFRDPAGGGELIGNLYFGGGGDGGDGGGGAVPATNTWGVILLIALFMGISLFYLRRRAKA
jgi:hypothetical protein